MLAEKVKKAVRGCQVEGCTECVPVYFSGPEEARDLVPNAHAESELYNIAEGSPAHCPAFADEDGCLLFLRDCTYPHPAGRGVKKDFQMRCGSDLSAVEVLPLEPVPLNPDTSVLNSDWEEYDSSDPVVGPIWDELDSRGVSGQFRLHAGRVRFRGRICVPLRILDDVMSGVHTYAHPGVYKTHQLFNRRYIVHEVSGGAVRKLQYHALYKRIQSVVSHCEVCQAVKGRKAVQPDTMTYCPIPEYPLSSVAMDFCHLPTVTRSKVEYDSELVVVCCLTRYVRAIPCNERMTSEQLASLFLEQVVSFFGLPKEPFSDNDKIIDASFFSTFCKLSGIEEYRSPVYCARSNGRAECAVQVVIDSLRKLLEQVSAQKVKHKHTWLDLLPLAIWSGNDLPGPISGYSPHRLLFGRYPVGFGEHPSLVADHGSEDALQFF